MNRFDGITSIVADKIARDSPLWSSGDFHNRSSEKGENFSLGGEIASVQIIDASKEHLAIFTHRALRHHTQGIFEAERVFGLSLTNGAGREIPIRWIGEQHVREDCQGRIPSLADWLGRIQPEPWMANGHIDRQAHEPVGDPRTEWLAEVAEGKTILGLKDWMEAMGL